MEERKEEISKYNLHKEKSLKTLIDSNLRSKKDSIFVKIKSEITSKIETSSQPSSWRNIE
jgi:hypothetical protein